VPIFDLVIWGCLGILIQVIVFYLFHLFAPVNVLTEIPNGNVAVAIFSSKLSIISGITLAALINY
jgi:putative membrane protein